FLLFQAEDGIRDFHVTGVQTCALPIFNVQAVRCTRLFIVFLKWNVERLASQLQDARNDVMEGFFGRNSALEGGCARDLETRILRSEERRVGKEWRAQRWSVGFTRKMT